MKRSLAAAVAVIVLAFGACGGGDDPEPPNSGNSDDSSLKVFETAPPWPLADRQADRIEAVGLPLLKAEGDKFHYHAHLDVFHNGIPVTVPANVGVDFERGVISPLHTHDESGIVHVEALEDDELTLGQFLTEWGVRVADDCIGDICGAENVAVYIDGVKQENVGTGLVFKSRQQIALVLGTPPKVIPATYASMPEQ